MAGQLINAADVLVCFDANLPKIEKCQPNCETKRSISCIHRFDRKVLVEHCNTKKFQGWSDLCIFMYFLGRIFESIAEGLVTPSSVFIILTKDRNFIDDVKNDWEKTKRLGSRLQLQFLGNSISCGGLVVFVQQIDCPNYGNTRKDDLKCAFYKVNNFLTS